MADAAVAANVHEPLYVLLNLGTKPPFHHVVILNDATELVDVLRGDVIHAHLGVDSGLRTDLARLLSADPEDVCQCDIYVFVGQVDAGYACHPTS